MDAAQALADLTEVSTQIEGAVLVDAGGALLASTFPEEKGKRVAEAALELLGAAERTQGEPARSRLAQVLAATPKGAVFLARDDRHVVAGVTAPDPTVGLIFYDLKTCLRLLEEEQKKPSRKKQAKSEKPAGARKKSGERARKSGDA